MSRLDSGSRSPECLQSCVQGCSRLQHPHPCTWDSTVRAGNAAEADPAWQPDSLPYITHQTSHFVSNTDS